MRSRYFLLAMTLVAIQANADNSTIDAAIGDGIAGAVGTAIITKDRCSGRRHYEGRDYHDVDYEPAYYHGEHGILPGSCRPLGHRVPAAPQLLQWAAGFIVRWYLYYKE